MSRRFFPVVLIEQGGSNDNPVGMDEFVYEPHQLGQQKFPAALPIRLHPVVYLRSGFKNDALHTELASQFIEINGGYLRDIRLALDHGRQFGDLDSSSGVQLQQRDPFRIESQMRTEYVIRCERG